MGEACVSSNNWKPNDLQQWNFKYQLAVQTYGPVSAILPDTNPSFPPVVWPPVCSGHAHPNITHFLCKLFIFTSNKKLSDSLQWRFTPCLQHFSQFNPPVDGIYFKIDPALSWLDDTTQTSIPTQFFLRFYEAVVITAVIKMSWPWKAMGSSLWTTFMKFGLNHCHPWFDLAIMAMCTCLPSSFCPKKGYFPVK